MFNIDKTGFNTDKLSRTIRNRTVLIENLTPDKDALKDKTKTITAKLYEIFSKYNKKSLDKETPT